jgi:hypothetical protein
LVAVLADIDLLLVLNEAVAVVVAG